MYSIEVIAQKIQCVNSSIHHNENIKHILTDSRSLLEPNETLFFALRSATGDGHKYIGKLFWHGVRNFVVAADAAIDFSQYPEANFVVVSDTLRAMQRLAAAWRREFHIPVIAITGSNGKTVTKEFAYQLLSPFYRIVRSPRSYNSQLGVALSVLKMSNEDELAIFEAGISEPAEMERLAAIIQPQYGIFTNIGSAHQENFTDLEEKIDEKLLLFAQCQSIVYDADCKDIYEGLVRNKLIDRAFGWSRVDEQAPLFLQSIEPQQQGLQLTLRALGKSFTCYAPFADNASIENIMHCIALSLLLCPDRFEVILQEVAALEPVKMRLEVKEGNDNTTIINDAYNNDVNSLAIALDFVKQRAAPMQSKKVVILSDILQSALSGKSLYRSVGEMIRKYEIDQFIGIGKSLLRYADFFDGVDAHFYADAEEFLKSKLAEELKDAVILVKGARIYHFESIVDRLSHKGHETTLEVNLPNLVANYRSYRKQLPHATKIMGMVKANAYGLGAYETAKALEDAGIDFLAVAVADEGKELRKKGIHTPLVIMDPGIGDIDTLIDYNLEPVVHSVTQYKRLAKRIDNEGFDNFPIHIELDTGMHRLGFLPAEVDELQQLIEHDRILRVKSIFTHLAAADEPEQDAFTEQQIHLFKECYNKLCSKLSYKPLAHILNTAGCERFAEHAMDMVRLGIGLYGVSPSGSVKVLPVVRLHTTLLQISNIPPNETVGYGRHGSLPNGGKVGIIPIGYADGYDRRFGRGVGKVMIGDNIYPTIGNICMDTCMIDLSAAPSELKEGDEVIIFGENKEMSLDVLSKAIGTIPYEIISDLASRIRRVYYRD